MEIITKKVDELVPYEKNPRKNDKAVDYVANSIKEFGFKVPIVIDKDNVIIAGHTRYKASKKLKLKEVPCIVADDLTEEQVKAFRLADNKVSEVAEWDMTLLGEELLDIEDLDMTDFGFELFDEEETEDKEEKGSLNDEYIIPPFSVFDTRQGYWQDRRRKWLNLGIKSEVGRKKDLTFATELTEKYGGGNLSSTSIFDPVLCEICYKWFNIDNGKIYDPFAGGSVRGIVASKLSYNYQGIDLREEQIEANKNNAKELECNPIYYCDDSNNVDKYIEDNSVDMIFSCPPYGDLEVYSDKENDLSNMEYDEFKEAYKNIITKACKKLKENRFAVFVVGDIRDKDGNYRNFVDYTKECFNKNGCNTYNEIILLNSLGTAPVRGKRPFNSGRKVTKVHQNILVFYKGDTKTIKDNYKKLNLDNIVGDEE